MEIENLAQRIKDILSILSANYQLVRFFPLKSCCKSTTYLDQIDLCLTQFFTENQFALLPHSWATYLNDFTDLQLCGNNTIFTEVDFFIFAFFRFLFN